MTKNHSLDMPVSWLKNNYKLLIFSFIIFISGFVFAQGMIWGLMCGLFIAMAADNAETEEEENKQKTFHLTALCLGSLVFIILGHLKIIPKELLMGNQSVGQVEMIVTIAFNWGGAIMGGVIGFSGD